MALPSAATPLTPGEFDEQRAAAEEDDVDHLIEDFDTHEEWNAYVAADHAQHAGHEADSTTRILDNWQTLGKHVGIFVLLLLAIKGAEGITDRGF